MIMEMIDKMMDEKRRVFPCNSNRASSIGFPCERYCTYCRTNWKDRKLPDLTLQYIFDYGNDVEKIVLRRMEDARVETFHQQRDFKEESQNITGHTDCFAKVQKLKFPVEIKSMSPFVFSTIATAEDIRYHKKPYIRSYYTQFQLYLYMSEYDKGCWILFNKLTSVMQEVWTELDLEHVESILKKAERINKHVEAATLPDRIPFDSDICEGCWFEAICLPDVQHRQNLYIEQEPEIARLLDERDACKTSAYVFDKLDKKVKAYAKKRAEANILVGNWMIKKTVRKDGAVIVKIERT